MRRQILSVTPPVEPQELPSQTEWRDAERRLGTSLPADYRKYVSVYGTAGFGASIWIFTPTAKNSYFNLVDQAERLLAADRQMRDFVGRDEFRLRLFPELGGLLPFGNTSNGDVLYWETIGEPDDWSVCVRESRDVTCERFALSMSAFLDGVLTGRVKGRAFPDGFPPSRPTIVLPAYLRGDV